MSTNTPDSTREYLWAHSSPVRSASGNPYSDGDSFTVKRLIEESRPESKLLEAEIDDVAALQGLLAGRVGQVSMVLWTVLDPSGEELESLKDKFRRMGALDFLDYLTGSEIASGRVLVGETPQSPEEFARMITVPTHLHIGTEQKQRHSMAEELPIAAGAGAFNKAVLALSPLISVSAGSSCIRGALEARLKVGGF